MTRSEASTDRNPGGENWNERGTATEQGFAVKLIGLRDAFAGGESASPASFVTNPVTASQTALSPKVRGESVHRALIYPCRQAY